jgi:hypothetical protein
VLFRPAMAFAPITAKLYAPPYTSTDNPHVLVVDPTTNATDMATLCATANGTGFRPRRGTTTSTVPIRTLWSGIAYAPVTSKLYCSPVDVTAVLVIDPVANTTDTAALGNLDDTLDKYSGIVYCPVTSKLYCSPSSAQ